MRPRALKILAHGGVSVLVREQVAGRLPPSAVLNEDEEQDDKEAKTKEKVAHEARGRRRSHML